MNASQLAYYLYFRDELNEGRAMKATQSYLMLYFYEIASWDDCGQYTYLLWKLERSFTSAIFEMVDPRARNNDYAKHLDLQVSQGESLYDFIQKNPGNMETFRR